VLGIVYSKYIRIRNENSFVECCNNGAKSIAYPAHVRQVIY